MKREWTIKRGKFQDDIDIIVDNETSEYVVSEKRYVNTTSETIFEQNRLDRVVLRKWWYGGVKCEERIFFIEDAMRMKKSEIEAIVEIMAYRDIYAIDKYEISKNDYRIEKHGHSYIAFFKEKNVFVCDVEKGFEKATEIVEGWKTLSSEF